MTTKKNELRSESVKRVLNELREKDLIVLTTHKNADGDGCGSQVALASWLRSQGTETFIVNPTPFPESFKFSVSDLQAYRQAGNAVPINVVEKVCVSVLNYLIQNKKSLKKVA